MEKIRINNTLYDLVPNGYQVTGQGGRITFLPGDQSFNVAKADLVAAKELEVLDDLGNPIISQSGLVYAGRVSLDDNYIIGTEQVQTGTDDAGDPVYDTRDITGAVLIAEFRVPDIRDQVAALEAQLAYVAMMANVDVEGV